MYIEIHNEAALAQSPTPHKHYKVLLHTYISSKITGNKFSLTRQLYDAGAEQPGVGNGQSLHPMNQEPVILSTIPFQQSGWG